MKTKEKSPWVAVEKIALANQVLGCLPIMPEPGKSDLRKRLMRLTKRDLNTMYRVLHGGLRELTRQ